MKQSLGKTVLIRVGITLGTVLICLIVAELYVRQTFTYIQNKHLTANDGVIENLAEPLVRYTGKGRRLVPNASVIIHNHYISKLDVEVETNSMGFRDSELNAVKGDDEIRILVLGDSITSSEYLPKEQSYTEIVESELESNLAGRRVEVINSGVMDIGTVEEISILEERGLDTQPDLILLAFYLNDSRPSWGFAAEIRHRGWWRRNSILVETLYTSMKLREWIIEKGDNRLDWIPHQYKLNWQTDREDFIELTEHAKYDFGAAWDESSWPKIAKQFDRLQKIAKQRGIPVAVIGFPVKFQVYADFVEDYPQQELKKLAEQFDFPLHDLLPILRSHKETKLFYDQCHLNVKGSQVVGEDIAHFLNKSKLIRPK